MTLVKNTLPSIDRLWRESHGAVIAMVEDDMPPLTVRPADAGQAAPAETSQTPKHSA
jgi:hypothetical protein